MKVQISQPLLIEVSVALHWMCTGLTDVSPILRSQNWTQYFSCHLDGKQRGIITAISILATWL